MHSPTASPLVFISHSNADREIAGALVALLRAALNLTPTEIRCTSVDGYRLPLGEATDQRLRQEVLGAEVLIALLSPKSLASTYVLFELGGRWGAGLPIAPVLVPGLDASSLKGPLAGLNALSAGVEAQLHQLVEDVARLLGKSPNSRAAFLGELKRLSAAREGTALPAPSQPSKAAESTAATSPIPEPELPAEHVALLRPFARSEDGVIRDLRGEYKKEICARFGWSPLKFEYHWDKFLERDLVRPAFPGFRLSREGRDLVVEMGLSEEKG